MAANKKIAPRGSGSVRQRPDGRWEARYIAADGKRRSIYGESQKEVMRLLREALKAVDDGSYLPPQRLTVSQWLDTWLAEYCAPSAKPLTLAAYKSKVENHLKPALGRCKLTALDATKIQRFLNSLSREKELSPKTVKLVHGILHRALQQAVELRYLNYNAADAVTLPRLEKKEVRPLTEDETRRFLDALEGEPLRDLITVALLTGMREGEICGLSWDAVDFEKGTVTVKQQLLKAKGRGAGHFVSSTKSDRARTLTVAPVVMDILRRVKAEQVKNHLAVGLAWENDNNFVFTNATGHFIVPETAYKTVKRIAAKIGRADLRFHSLRHSYAVNALQAGDALKTVSENLGHATASFTADVYGHISERMKQESAERMQNFYESLGVKKG